MYVAEGDSQKLRCSYSGTSDILKTLKFEWEPPAPKSNYTENARQEFIKDGKLTLILEIEIEQFDGIHDGRWYCILKTSNSEEKNYINLSLIDGELC